MYTDKNLVEVSQSTLKDLWAFQPWALISALQAQDRQDCASKV